MRAPSLPRWAERILRWVLPADWCDDILSDLGEVYIQRRQGSRFAPVWLLGQVIAFTVTFGLATFREVAAGGAGLDLKQAIRALKRRPGLSGTVIATVALAVGATTAGYSVVDGVLLRPLPYPGANELVRVWQTRADWGQSTNPTMRQMSNRLWPQAPIYREWLRTETGFSSLGAYVDAVFTIPAADGARVVRGQEATAGLFDALGIQPVLGRVLLPADDAEGAPQVVVLGEGFWRERFDGRDEALGQQLILNGAPHTVIGVMPDGFHPPSDEFWEQLLGGGVPLLWTSLGDEARSGDKSVSVLGRLQPGLDLEAAELRFAQVHSVMVDAGLDQLGETGVRVESLLDSVVGDVRTTLWFLLAAVGLVLLVATVNIANMMTASGLARRRELAVRSALGAATGQLVRGLFLESAVLSALGGLGGILLAWVALPTLSTWIPSSLPRHEEIGISISVLMFGLAVTGLTAVLVGVLPGLLASRADPQQALRAAGRGATSGRTAGRLRSALVVAEVGLAFVLLIGAGLLATSYARLWATDRGFAPEELVAMRVVPDFESLPTRQERDQFRTELRARLNALGLRATAMNNVPLSGGTSLTSAWVHRAGEEAQELTAVLSVGLPDYFEVMQIPLLIGRPFDGGDEAGSPNVAIVNRSMAEQYWPGTDAVGQRIRTGDDPNLEIEVVGIVADVRNAELSRSAQPTVYRPAAQTRRSIDEWVLRVRGDQGAALAQARSVVAELSSSTPVRRTFVMQERIAESVAIPRFRTFFITGLAGLAAILALLGVYGALAFVVAQRTKEIGVRMALGAGQRRVLVGVIGAGLRLVGAGIVVGMVLARLGAGAVERFLFDVTPTDPVTYIAIVIALLVVGGLAAFWPAQRAARVDPVQVLSGE